MERTPDFLADRGVYRSWWRDVIRYGDTDRQGHVNNAVFATFLESGRVRFLYDPSNDMPPAGCGFVIAQMLVDFREELHWPGEVEIGTVVLKIGRSSVSLGQGLFSGERCVAAAQTVLVLMDDTTRRSTPFPDATRRRLESFSRG
jgi:acyl-CoA thioester hydrolase